MLPRQRGSWSRTLSNEGSLGGPASGTVFKGSAADGRRARGEERNEKLDHTVCFISVLYKDYGSVG